MPAISFSKTFVIQIYSLPTNKYEMGEHHALLNILKKHSSSWKSLNIDKLRTMEKKYEKNLIVKPKSKLDSADAVPHDLFKLFHTLNVESFC